MHRYSGIKLSGIVGLKDKFRGSSAVVGCSGPTFKDYDSSLVPGKHVVRVAVNESIRKMQDADFWVLSDTQIVLEYAKHCPKKTTILAMRDAVRRIGRDCPDNKIHTVDSMADPRQKYDNGYQFFSRGTVLIGAIEMMRYLGIERFYIFGLDCYRTKDAYYYDGRRPQHPTELKMIDKERDRQNDVWVTSRLRKMIDVLNKVKAADLWKKIEIYCVGSPLSKQEAIEKMELGAFKKAMRGEANKGRRAKRPPVVIEVAKAPVIVEEPPVEEPPVEEAVDPRDGDSSVEKPSEVYENIMEEVGTTSALFYPEETDNIAPGAIEAVEAVNKEKELEKENAGEAEVPDGEQSKEEPDNRSGETVDPAVD